MHPRLFLCLAVLCSAATIASADPADSATPVDIQLTELNLQSVDPSYLSGGFYPDPPVHGKILDLNLVPAEIPEPTAAFLVGGVLAVVLFLDRRRRTHLL